MSRASDGVPRPMIAEILLRLRTALVALAAAAFGAIGTGWWLFWYLIG